MVTGLVQNVFFYKLYLINKYSRKGLTNEMEKLYERMTGLFNEFKKATASPVSAPSAAPSSNGPKSNNAPTTGATIKGGSTGAKATMHKEVHRSVGQQKELHKKKSQEDHQKPAHKSSSSPKSSSHKKH